MRGGYNIIIARENQVYQYKGVNNNSTVNVLRSPVIDPLMIAAHIDNHEDK